ncbi:MAG: hypothetical protein K2W82_06365 [Candidatus Obscuribacterales bacterium]|jgi:hypothetical protein|nr:hypothetical protein [Candidatus Obscuribacterales bacterium]
MEDLALTNDEKRCLQMWFRQAIAHVEREEALKALEAEALAAPSKEPHSAITVRRTRRTRLSAAVESLS